MRWFNSITDSTDMHLSKLWEIVKNRHSLLYNPWKVYNLEKPCNEWVKSKVENRRNYDV